MKFGILHQIDILQKEEFLKALTHRVANELLDHWEEKLNSSPTSNIYPYFDHFLFFLSMRENILAAVIYDQTNKKTIFKYGVSKLFSETKTNVAGPVPGSNEIRVYKDQEVQIKQASFQSLDRLGHYTISIAAPVKTDIQPYWLKFRRIFITYYIFRFKQEDIRVLNLFKTIGTNVVNLMNTPINQEKSSCLTYFKFKPLRTYAKLIGGYFLPELERYVSNSIKEKMTADDRLYILSPQDLLLVSLDSADEDIKARFHEVSFRMKDVLITYKINFFMVQHRIKDLTSIWDKIAID